ncbi:hypothetical protein GCM10010124_31600 [Pilimelia terevasa]|uniref:Uncharacterized protein n=1 Tax=Pilimelia terevasa TaxID=53372 RepID=A0A8J3BSU6_9ACTN|nr:hypothetical protein [Pilimelia terevasa]GGK36642.1 hypothetical protein GCM10010124_31600 [Pilimelia terevasa]
MVIIGAEQRSLWTELLRRVWRATHDGADPDPHWLADTAKTLAAATQTTVGREREQALFAELRQLREQGRIDLDTATAVQRAFEALTVPVGGLVEAHARVRLGVVGRDREAAIDAAQDVLREVLGADACELLSLRIRCASPAGHAGPPPT